MSEYVICESKLARINALKQAISKMELEVNGAPGEQERLMLHQLYLELEELQPGSVEVHKKKGMLTTRKLFMDDDLKWADRLNLNYIDNCLAT